MGLYTFRVKAISFALCRASFPWGLRVVSYDFVRGFGLRVNACCAHRVADVRVVWSGLFWIACLGPLDCELRAYVLASSLAVWLRCGLRCVLCDCGQWIVSCDLAGWFRCLRLFYGAGSAKCCVFGGFGLRVKTWRGCVAAGFRLWDRTCIVLTAWLEASGCEFRLGVRASLLVFGLWGCVCVVLRAWRFSVAI